MDTTSKTKIVEWELPKLHKSQLEVAKSKKRFNYQIKQILTKSGDTNVQIRIIEDAKNYAFKLRNKRLVDRSHINLLKKQGITTNIF